MMAYCVLRVFHSGPLTALSGMTGLQLLDLSINQFSGALWFGAVYHYIPCYDLSDGASSVHLVVPVGRYPYMVNVFNIISKNKILKTTKANIHVHQLCFIMIAESVQNVQSVKKNIVLNMLQLDVETIENVETANMFLFFFFHFVEFGWRINIDYNSLLFMW
jgi:hypothetical protein